MNELIVAGILAAIALACLCVFGIPYIIFRSILRIVRHEKMMRPQNVYFIGR
jgi:predicted RND superfamily exporter protein